MESCCEVSRTFKVAYWINREFGTGWWYDTREAEAAGGNRIESVLSFTFCPSKSEAVTISIGINNQSSRRSHWHPHATTGHLCEEPKLAFAVLHWWSGFSHSLLVFLLLFSKTLFPFCLGGPRFPINYLTKYHTWLLRDNSNSCDRPCVWNSSWSLFRNFVRQQAWLT